MKYIKPKIKLKKIKRSLLFTRERYVDYDLLAAICFLPRTKILMANGKKKNIETIQMGDMVCSYDLERSTPIKESVEQLYVHPKRKIEYLIINNSLQLTKNHPLWVNGEQWRSAEELKINDRLLDPEGKIIVITSIIKKTGQFTVYNLGLNGPNNNYFSENILVHNRSICNCLTSTCTGC